MVVFLILPVVIIYFLGLLNVRLITRLLFVFTRSTSAVVWLLALIFLPGTFIHEMGHFLFAEFMLVKTDDLHLVPEIIDDNSVKLGGIRVEQTDVIRRTIIGLAPILTGILLMWIASYIVLTYFAYSMWALFAYIYLLIQVTHTMFSSRKDLEGAVFGFLAISIIIALLVWISTIIYIPAFAKVIQDIEDFAVRHVAYLRYGLWYGVVVDVLISLSTWTVLKLLRR